MFKSLLLDHIELFEGLNCLEKEVMQAALICDKTLKSGGKIIFCGNGGSAMDCQHIAAELTGRFEKDRIPLAALSLTADNCALTCISNDYKYDFFIPIKYNFKKVIPGNGSAIFIHLTKNYKPTAGCIALSKKDFLVLIKLINKNTKIRILK